MSSGVSGSNSAFRRRVERAAELRSVRASGSTAQENDELNTAEEELRQKRAKIDDAAKAEYLIRDAMAQGKFDNLKYAGKPIPGLGEAYDPDWWVKGLIEREKITGIAPPAVGLRAEDAALDGELDRMATGAGPRGPHRLQPPRRRGAPPAAGRPAGRHAAAGGRGRGQRLAAAPRGTACSRARGRAARTGRGHAPPVVAPTPRRPLGGASLSSAVASGGRCVRWPGALMTEREASFVSTDDNAASVRAGRRVAGHGTGRHV